MPVILGLAIGEVGARLLLGRPGFMPANREGAAGLLERLSGSARGYGYRPGASAQVGPSGSEISVAINRRGFRDAEWSESTTGGVLAAGDSFTAGWGVEASQAWPQQLDLDLEARLGDRAPRVHNSGVSGYGMHQIRATVEELLSELDPLAVVVAVYASRAARIGNPYVVVDGSLIARSEVERSAQVEGGFVRSSWSGALGRVERFCDRWFYLGSHSLRLLSRVLKRSAGGPQSPAEVVEPLLRELGSMRDVVAARGAHLSVVLVHNQDADGTVGGFEGKFAEQVAQWCVREEVHCIDPLPALQEAAEGVAGVGLLRLGDDPHWSALAHQLVATEIAAELAPLVSGGAEP